MKPGQHHYLYLMNLKKEVGKLKGDQKSVSRGPRAQERCRQDIAQETGEARQQREGTDRGEGAQ